MSSLDLARITQFANQNIDTFHQNRLAKIQALQLRGILSRKNPYLFRAKNIVSASELVASILDASLSSSEEGLFGGFLEQLAIFINEMAFGGQKSSATGIDLEFNRDRTRYLVAIKSGPNWGNSSQYEALRANFKNALKVLRQNPQIGDVRAVLGTCYGKAITVDNGAYTRICGQNFWEFISGNGHLFIDLIEPLGFAAQAHNEYFTQQKNETYLRMVRQFTAEFCDESGLIDWPKLVNFNSGNRPESTI